MDRDLDRDFDRGLGALPGTARFKPEGKGGGGFSEGGRGLLPRALDLPIVEGSLSEMTGASYSFLGSC